MGRSTQGVRLISLRGNDQIASVCRVPKSDEEDVNEDDSPDSSEDQANPESTTE
jgi:DNA gyrase subunit A